MESKLRFKKETEDHSLVGTMTRFMKKGFKFLGDLATPIMNYIFNIISKLEKKAIEGSLFSAISSTFKDENVWVIDNGTYRHMTGECNQI